MSEIKVNSIKGVGASTAAITVNNTDGSATANLTNRQNRNLIINGAMQVAQRGTSSSSNSGGMTVDRFGVYPSNTDEAPTFEQVDVTSGTTPYNLGLTKALKVTNGNQTSGAGADDNIRILYKIESQDLRNSGWNYLSSSSYVTLSFYVKSSVAQNFNFALRTKDGPDRGYAYETGSLSADTWTKVTKKIPGDSTLQFDNDSGPGLELNFWMFLGTNSTGTRTLNAWHTFDSTTVTPDQTSTWYTTNDATFELTGVQLEVSDHATSFEHRSFGQELALCQRYFHKIESGSTDVYLNTLQAYASGAVFGVYYHFPVTMRATPTTTVTGTITPTNSAGNFAGNLSSFTFDRNTPDLVASNNTSGGSGLSAGDAALIALRANTSASISSDAEL